MVKYWTKFIVDAADLARKTDEGMLALADRTADISGFMGHHDCLATLAEAIENSEMRDQVFCYEGTNNHLAATDELRFTHPLTNSGLRQVIMAIVKLHVTFRKEQTNLSEGRLTCHPCSSKVLDVEGQWPHSLYTPLWR